jgi:hypothetical protein
MSDWLSVLIAAGGTAGVSAALSKPLTKLIETVGGAVGVLYEPIRIVKKAEAESKAGIIKAKASADEQDLIEYRASERMEWKELRRQRNIESIAKIAYEQLPEEVSEEKVDEDWTVQFFNLSQDISNEEMQIIWGKILAGEVAKPGSYSLITINTLKMLRQQDATLFKRLANFLWSGRYIFLHSESTYTYIKSQGIIWPDFLHLETLGLLNLHINWTIRPKEGLIFTYFNQRYNIINDGENERYLSGHQFTQAGIELLTLCDKGPDEEYISSLIVSYSTGEYTKLRFEKI